MGSNLLRVTIVAALGLSYCHAYDCWLEAWDSNTVYTSGDLVQTSNHAYQASHWTQGNDRQKFWGWQTWQDLGQCDTGRVTPLQSIYISPVNNAEILKAQPPQYRLPPVIAMAASLM